MSEQPENKKGRIELLADALQDQFDGIMAHLLDHAKDESLGAYREAVTHTLRGLEKAHSSLSGLVDGKDWPCGVATACAVLFPVDTNDGVKLVLDLSARPACDPMVNSLFLSHLAHLQMDMLQHMAQGMDRVRAKEQILEKMQLDPVDLATAQETVEEKKAP